MIIFRKLIGQNIKHIKHDENKPYMGMMEHHENFSLIDVSHIVSSIDDNSIAKIEILNTPKGNILKSLLNNGANIDFVVRGIGDGETIKKIVSIDAILNNNQKQND